MMVDFKSVAVSYRRQGNRNVQAIWNLVGNDPAEQMFNSLYKELEFHLFQIEDWEETEKAFVDIWIKFELSAYDKLAAKHQKPSVEYAKIIAGA